MSPELDKELCEKYPKIFCDRHGDIKETCMAWGFECGDGWAQLIDTTCFLIQQQHDNNLRSIRWAEAWNQDILDPDSDYYGREPRVVPEEIPQTVATQIKEKFGTLRFYVNGGDDYIQGVIDMAEYMSAYICEVCGNKTKVADQGGGWYATRCEEHQ